MDGKVRVIYIASSPRSGSTLMDKVIGSSRYAIGVGELALLKNFLKEQEFRTRGTGNWCDDTGKRLQESQFWREVIEDLHVDKLYERNVYRNDMTALFSLICKTGTYNTEDGKLYKNILRQGQRWKGEDVCCVVDSSKDLFRLKSLLNNPNLKVTVFHLIRKAESVVRSNIRAKREPDNVTNTLREFGHWFVVNVLSVVIGKMYRSSGYIRLRYEDFVADADMGVNFLNAQLGLKLRQDTLLSEINDEMSIRFAGNRKVRAMPIRKIGASNVASQERPSTKAWLVRALGAALWSLLRTQALRDAQTSRKLPDR